MPGKDEPMDVENGPTAEQNGDEQKPATEEAQKPEGEQTPEGETPAAKEVRL